MTRKKTKQNNKTATNKQEALDWKEGSCALSLEAEEYIIEKKDSIGATNKLHSLIKWQSRDIVYGTVYMLTHVDMYFLHF